MAGRRMPSLPRARWLTLSVVGAAMVMVGALVALSVGREDGYLMMAPATFQSPSTAIVIDGAAPLGHPFVSAFLAEDNQYFLGGGALARSQAVSRGPGALFLGSTSAAAAEDYLAGAAHDEIDGWETQNSCENYNPNAGGSHICHVVYTRHEGSSAAAPPGEQLIWSASAEGTGLLTLDWPLPSDGDHALVIMNADGSAGITADLAFGGKGANEPRVFVVVGSIPIVLGLVLVVVGIKRARTPESAAAVSPPANWYPDPANPTQLRYWDGANWTGHLHERPQPATPRRQQ